MSPEQGSDPDQGVSGGGLRRGPVVGSDGAAAPVGGELSLPADVPDSRWAWDGDALPVRHRPTPEAAAAPLDPFGEQPVVPAPRAEPDDTAIATVRPYVLTGGRTRAQLDLSLETLVSTLPKVVPYQLPYDEAAVLDLCRTESRSVAEVAALHRVPIGVAKVLIADLATAGLLTVHRSFAATGPDLLLMERVLGGLRRI
jgi:Protein of unknown function (DUF742)